MAIFFLESFGWPSLGQTGNPWTERGYTISGDVYTDQSIGREGSGYACVVVNGGDITFPAGTRKSTMTIGFSYAARVNVNAELFRLTLNNTTSGAYISVSSNIINYTFGNVSGSFLIDTRNEEYAFLELSVSGSLITLRINNSIAASVSGGSYTAGAGSVFIDGRGNFKMGDVYISNDAIARGDSFVKKMPLDGVFENTGLKEGPAPTIDDGLSTFSNVDFVSYDQSNELTTLEVDDALTGIISAVKAVGIRYNTIKTNNDSVVAIPYIDTSARFELPSHLPGLNYKSVDYVVEKDPIDNMNWNVSKLSQLRVGIKRQ